MNRMNAFPNIQISCVCFMFCLSSSHHRNEFLNHLAPLFLLSSPSDFSLLELLFCRSGPGPCGWQACASFFFILNPTLGRAVNVVVTVTVVIVVVDSFLNPSRRVGSVVSKEESLVNRLIVLLSPVKNISKWRRILSNHS